MTAGNVFRADNLPTFSYSKVWSGQDDAVAKTRENEYTMTLRNWWGEPTSYKIGVNGSTVTGGSGATSISDQFSWPNPDGNAVLECLAQISENIRGHSFNAAIFAAESKESLATVINTLRSVFHAFSAIKRRDLGGALRSLGKLPGQSSKKADKSLQAGDIPGAWLSIRYGWQPLLNDIYEAMKAYETRSNGARGIVVRSHKDLKPVIGDVGNAANWRNFRAMTVTRSSLRYKVTFKENLSVARTLGLLNPAAVLWEKLPYSFVVDWALPIGSYLDSLGIFTGLQLEYARTYFYRKDDFIKQTVSWTGSPQQQPGYIDLSYPAKGVYTLIHIERTRGTSLSVPIPSLKSLEKTFSIGHIQNASALIAQLVINARK